MALQLKRTARRTLKALAVAVDPLFGPLPGPRILIYHQVGVDLGREMEVSTEVFASHLDWLQAHGQIVHLETAVERRGDVNADRLFVLTFDDGFRDVYQNAFPLLREREIPFTLYLTTGPIDTGGVLDSRYPDALALTWDQVNEMAATGLGTIGAHTHSHCDLRRASRDVVIDELDTSNLLIRENTGLTPRHFTYPWGWWSETADLLVRERYETATVGSTSPITFESDLLTLGRYPVQASDGMTWFARRIERGLRLENSLRRRRAGYSGP